MRPLYLMKPELAELVHEKAHARTRRADHFRKRFLADLRDDRIRPAFLAEIGEEQKHARKPLFARVEQLINEVLLDADGARQEVGDEQSRKMRAHRGATRTMAAFSRRMIGGVRHRLDGCHAARLPGKAALAEEIVRAENCDHRFLALLGNNGDLDLALLNIEDGIRRFALRENGLVSFGTCRCCDLRRPLQERLLGRMARLL